MLLTNQMAKRKQRLRIVCPSRIIDSVLLFYPPRGRISIRLRAGSYCSLRLNQFTDSSPIKWLTDGGAMQTIRCRNILCIRSFQKNPSIKFIGVHARIESTHQ